MFHLHVSHMEVNDVSKKLSRKEKTSSDFILYKRASNKIEILNWLQDAHSVDLISLYKLINLWKYSTQYNCTQQSECSQRAGV